MHPSVYAYELHADSVLTHPFPVVMHPDRNMLQAVFVAVVAGASEQAKGLHAVAPVPVLAVHTPSLPIIPVHPAAIVYELHNPNEATHPLPVLKHVLIHP